MQRATDGTQDGRPVSQGRCRWGVSRMSVMDTSRGGGVAIGCHRSALARMPRHICRNTCISRPNAKLAKQYNPVSKSHTQQPINHSHGSTRTHSDRVHLPRPLHQPLDVGQHYREPSGVEARDGLERMRDGLIVQDQPGHLFPELILLQIPVVGGGAM